MLMVTALLFVSIALVEFPILSFSVLSLWLIFHGATSEISIKLVELKHHISNNLEGQEPGKVTLYKGVKVHNDVTTIVMN